MKYIVTPVNKQNLNQFLQDERITDILVGIEFLSNAFVYELDIDQLNKVLNKTNKISINLSRLFHENEIDKVYEKLNKINFDKVKLVFYSDFLIYSILKEKNLLKKAVYNGYTYTTNVSDINLYGKFNEYICVSNQISIDEINYVLENADKNVIVYGFGKSIIFSSRRKLLTNYFKYRNLDNNPYDKNYYLKEEYRNDLYHIIEDKNGSYIYESGYYYLFDELKNKSKIDYLILDSCDLNQKNYEKVVDAYLENNIDKLCNLDIKLYKGIMQEKSVLLKSEVKSNE